ncbi:hypothetical protein AB1Y20_005064 [Prymnesium parvum]|uniref:Calmodulin n=1 Tax=Prymnesium parvum TaxID=97485 RepID=A0AB34J573_PRYPA
MELLLLSLGAAALHPRAPPAWPLPPASRRPPPPTSMRPSLLPRLLPPSPRAAAFAVADAAAAAASLSLAAEAAAKSADLSSVSLDALGRDLLIFLSASVAVRPAARALNINPILLFLLIGAILGPHGLNIFANTVADVEIGDFGVLFLLFAEGLEVSPERLSSLTAYLPLGLSQLGLTTAVFTALILLFSSSGQFGWVSEWIERYIPLNNGYVDIANPSEALVLALAATLSSSAFVFPVLQSKGWEDRSSGVAGKSTLLLQDLAVAPVLVLLPFVLGSGQSDMGALAILLAKATFGFGAVFQAVADAQATESFVALVVLVAVGMGIIAEQLGLTNTAGAFAAGVLLANTNFRAQIQADIVPFEGILLGIFFMTTGSNFDASLLLAEWPTVLTATALLLGVKVSVLAVSALIGGLSLAEGIRFSLLLAGGGEFAFIIFGLGERLGVLPDRLTGLLTGVVLISMSLTPLLAEVASALSAPLVRERDDLRSMPQRAISDEEWDAARRIRVASNAVVVCGYGELGCAVYRALQLSLGMKGKTYSAAPLVAFELKPNRVVQGVLKGDAVIYGDAANVELMRAAGVSQPKAVFVTYAKHSRCLATVSRLRKSFPKVKIYSRASSPSEVDALLAAGATECVDASEETAVQLARCLVGADSPEHILRLQLHQAMSNQDWTVNKSAEALRATALAAGVSERTARWLYSLYNEMDLNGDGVVKVSEVRAVVEGAGEGNAVLMGVDRAALRRSLAKSDANGDDEMDFNQFITMVTRDRNAWPWEEPDGPSSIPEGDMRAAVKAGFSEAEAERLFELYVSLDRDDDGQVDIEEVRTLLSKTTLGIRSDATLRKWLEGLDVDGDGSLDFPEFLRMYSDKS